MYLPEWIWLIFLFALGCCIGSFLNVVIYRLPCGKSVIKPPSACPTCGRGIRFYDNIPLISWLLLGRKCRYCKAPISPRYFIIELFTGLVFVGLYILYFVVGVRGSIGSFLNSGWLIYLFHIILLSALIAASAIDLELWVIPLPICWFATAAGLVGSAVGVYVIDTADGLLLIASAKTGLLAAGAAIGLAVSLVLVATGVIKRSYEADHPGETTDPAQQEPDEPQISHRLEVLKEAVFLLPIIICSGIAFGIVGQNRQIFDSWDGFLRQYPVIAGLLGSLWGYFVGCSVVWGTRILGTLAFGREAMGLGDVHLMGAAGAVMGAGVVVVAFFIAPFFGLTWAGFQMFFKKTRQIPYGPFLSFGIVTVMISHDWIFSRLAMVFYH